MSEKTVRVCDMCGKVFKDVETYDVLVRKGHRTDSVEIVCTTVDLCPAHLTRLQGFVERGCSPLKGKA